jgi:hypothetical protein
MPFAFGGTKSTPQDLVYFASSGQEPSNSPKRGVVVGMIQPKLRGDEGFSIIFGGWLRLFGRLDIPL